MEGITVIRSKRRPKNNLEQFLRDIHRYELKFKIEREEVKFIQTSVELLIKTLVRVIEVEARQFIEQIKLEYRNAFPSLWLLPNTDNVVGVGSYYEKTKNGYPDQFDFNFVLFTFYSEPLTNNKYASFGYTHDPSFKKLHKVIQHLLNQKRLREKLLVAENGRVIRFERYDELVGPTSKLLFSYREGQSCRIINVDLILAVRRVDPLLHHRKLHPFKPYMAAIADTGCLQYVNDKITFPETEVYVMKNMVSRKHRKACQILKYLINGHKDGRILEKRLRRAGLFSEIITSNMIKTEIIMHEFKCIRSDRYIYPCVLQILDSLQDHDSESSLDTLTGGEVHIHLFRSVDRMKFIDSMITSLTAMMHSSEPYIYKRDRITPLARSLLIYPKPHIVQYTKRNMLDGCWCVGSYLYHIVLFAFSVFMVTVFVTVLIYSLR